MLIQTVWTQSKYSVLDSDDGKTIAEVFEQGEEAVIARYKNQPDAWHGFVEWYKNTQ